MNKEAFTEDQIKGKVLDHLGLVAAAIERLGLVHRIDKALPVSEEKGAKVTMGQRVAAMILNGLGFMDTRLYMFTEFMENKAVERLIGEGVSAEHFTDDALGRCLDSIYEYGPTRLFSQLAFEIGSKLNLFGKSAHFDSTTLSVEGDYIEDEVKENKEQQTEKAEGNKSCKEQEMQLSEEPSKDLVVTYGYSKDGRRDLKQVVLNLATTGAASFPIWMESHSGNASDKKILQEAAQRMQNFCNKLEGSPNFLYVADSAAYENCVKKGGELRWISRVPETIKAAKEILQQPDESFVWSEKDDKGYRQCFIENKRGGVHQRWCIVHSAQAHKKEIKTLEKVIRKEQESLEKKLEKLGKKRFSDIEKAREALEKLKAPLKFHSVSEVFETVSQHKKRGRPKEGDLPEIVGYQVKGTLQAEEGKIELKRNQKGRFIIATNELDRDVLPDHQLLPEYKEQSKTESGFRFIKDDTFEVSSVFLKKSSRISALMMIMTLCLMVYSYAQYHLRECLKKANEYLPDSLGKLTQNASIQRTFRLFQGVQVLSIQLQDYIQELVINLNDLLRRIIIYFGPKAKNIYGLSG